MMCFLICGSVGTNCVVVFISLLLYNVGNYSKGGSNMENLDTIIESLKRINEEIEAQKNFGKQELEALSLVKTEMENKVREAEEIIRRIK